MFTVDGLASGLDTTGIIQQILQLERRPIDLINTQIEQATQRQTAFLDLQARLLNLQVTSKGLSDPTTFQSVAVNSSNADVLEASADAGVPPGVYSFRTAQLASSSQFISRGFADADSTAVGAGTLTLELGSGFVDVQTEVDELNGGTGIDRGSIRITDSAGNSKVIDLTAAITVDDILSEINDTPGIDVTASIAGSANTHTGRGLVLEDGAGGVGTLTVEEIGGGSTAADLGILGSAVGTTLEGNRVHYLGTDTFLDSLNDGIGIRGDGTIANDFSIVDKAGNPAWEFDVDAMTTVQDLIDAVEGTGSFTLAINASGDGFDLTDTTGGGGALTVSELGDSAAADLGLLGTTGGATISGTQVHSGINDILLRTLNGGSGVAAGSILITDRTGAATAVDLSTASSLQDVMRLINDSAAPVTATVDPEGNGVQLRDTSGGTGSLTVAESGSTTAADLGILGTTTTDRLNGTDLNPNYFHANTQLSTLNGGAGVADGQIRITDANGVSFTVSLINNTTAADAKRDIEGAASAAGSDLTIDYNANGNGFLITSPTGGGTLTIAEVSGGTTARDLHILGSGSTATPNIIDGAFEESITISATDTLNDVLTAIQELGVDVSASIVNDGSTVAPNRLSIISNATGRAGRLIVDPSGGTNLSFSKTSEARDAVIFFGETSGGAEPLLLRSSTNTFSDVIDGMTLSAFQVSDTATQVTVATDNEAITESVRELVDKVNAVLDQVTDLTSFNLETEDRGVLLGDSSVNSLARNLISQLTGSLSSIANDFTLVAEVGIRVRNGRLSFDSGEFRQALETNRSAVQSLFGASRPFEDSTRLEDFRNGSGVRTETGEDDFRIHLRDGTTVDVDVSGAVTLEDVINAINTAGAGSITATYLTNQNSLELTDTTSGSDSFRVTVLNTSGASVDLGIRADADISGGDTITGRVVDLSDDVGVSSRLTDYIETLTNSDTGILQSRANNIDSQVEDLNDRISDLEERLTNREEALRRQFAQLEEIVSTSQSTLARLTAQLGGLG